jgi:PAS domain S-box-containing protein
MKKAARILIVEDIPTDAELAEREICKVLKSCTFHLVETRKEFLKALETFQPDVILSDYTLPNFDGLTALKLARKHAPLTPFIIWTGFSSEDIAVDCLKAGANNYVLKENIKRLGPAVLRALEERELLLARKQAEEAIQNSEKRFRALIENGLDDISLLAADGTLLWESPSTVRNLGYVPGEYLTHNIFEIMHPDDLAWTRNVFARLIQEPGARQSGIFRLRRSDGTWRWVEAIAHNMLNEPSVNAIVVNYRDITERKQAEEMLREERNLLRTLIDNIPDRIYVWILMVEKPYRTQQMASLRGKTMEDVMGKTDLDTYPPDLAEEFWQLDQAIIDSGQALINYEEPGLDAEGHRVSILTTKIPLRDREGKVVGLVGIGRDITERKQVEEHISDLLSFNEKILNHSAVGILTPIR